MKFSNILELDARLSSQMRVAEKPGLLRNIAIFFAHSGVAAVILGATAPIVLTSRSDSDQAKYYSILLAAAISRP